MNDIDDASLSRERQKARELRGSQWWKRSCKACNSKKKYMLPIEWEEYLQSIRESGVE
jgi:hypothetical protein